MKLGEIAHSRTGDKGDTSNISLIAYRLKDYPILAKFVTEERVKEWFTDILRGKVKKVDIYKVEQLGALNIVMYEALGGGVTRSLALDKHGKTLSSALLEIDIPDRLIKDFK